MAAAALLGAAIVFAIYQVRVDEEIVIDYKDEAYTWNARIGTRDGDVLVRGEKIDEIKHDIEKLVFAVNRSDKNPESFRCPEDKNPTKPPKLKFIEHKGGVVTVAVINDRYLTQRMGSTGAEAFMATATFTLTDHEAVDAVHFIFRQGDHAAPGMYSRDLFRIYWKIKNEKPISDPPAKPAARTAAA